MDEKERFNQFLDAVKVDPKLDRQFLFEMLQATMDGASSLKESNPIIASMGINPVPLTLYLISEHGFYLLTHPDKKQEELVEDEEYCQFLASVALDKYITNEHLAYRMDPVASRFSPSMSTLDLYLNFILGMLSRYKKGDPSQTLFIDIMNKGFQVAKCVASLLEEGFETNAFSTWRTLHENECILQVIVRHGKPVVDEYLKHIRYGVAFRGGVYSKEETDAIFVQIKEEMKAIDLKSKDMKRFIEYGWLLGVKDVMKIENFKFNFRDGVEKVAGLSSYSKVYEMSSEVAHSSPILIYSRKNYFYSIALLNLYESFFRLEKIFSSMYMSTVGENEKKQYVRMRSLYYWELLAAYEMEKKRFASFSNASKKKEA